MNVSKTKSLVLSNIFPVSLHPNSFTLLFKALLQTTENNAPGTPCPV